MRQSGTKGLFKEFANQNHMWWMCVEGGGGRCVCPCVCTCVCVSRCTHPPPTPYYYVCVCAYQYVRVHIVFISMCVSHIINPEKLSGTTAKDAVLLAACLEGLCPLGSGSTPYK